MGSQRQQVEAYIIEKGAFGWYVIDWDYEGDGETIAGPFKSRQAAAYKAIELSY